MANSITADTDTKTKYALFDFDDLSVEVGEVRWIRNARLQASNFDNGLLDEIVKKGEKVNVEWPLPRGTGRKPQGSQGNAELQAQATVICSAVVLAISESKEKLLGKRNKFCNGDGLKTDVDTGSGRGKRKRRPRRVWTSSEESMSESSDDDVPMTNQKKTKLTKNVNQCSKLAVALRKKLQEEPAKSIKPCLELAGPSSLSEPEEGDSQFLAVQVQTLEKELARERMEKEKLKETLGFVKDIPRLMARMDQFMTDMEPVLVKIKKSRLPQSASNSPGSSTGSESLTLVPGPSTEASPVICEDLKDKVQLGPHVALSKRALSNCNHVDAGKLTADLMMVVFGREVLLNSSLTGSRNKDGKMKPPLKKEQVSDIIAYVKRTFPAASPHYVRSVMTNKLSNEAKKEKRKLLYDGHAEQLATEVEAANDEVVQ